MAEEYQDLNTLVKEAITVFKCNFNSEPTVAACAPGRVNLIGEHTDYNDGFVLPIALPLVTVVVGRPTQDGLVKIVTNKIGLTDENKTEFSLAKDEIKPGEPKWANYVKGVIALFPDCTTGFEAVYHSTVPLGGGLSSSASIEVATYTFLEALTNRTTSSLTDKALICQKAEHKYAGVPCGIMDQFISTMGKDGQALLIDCKTHTYELIPMQDPHLVILITNSNVKHDLTGGEYPLRKQQCLEAAKLLNVSSLRDAKLADIKKLEKLKANPDVIKRGRHVISEIARTETAAKLLKDKNYVKFGKLMVESHNSLRDDFEVSTPELDTLVSAAMAVTGVYGSRMTGAGFGGCTVTLVKKESVNEVINNMKKKYSGKPTFYICVASEGAKIISLDGEQEC